MDSQNNKEGFACVRGTNIYYDVIGSGTPLVFLHGNGQNHKVFLKHLKAFKDNYQIILIDSRGHGASAVGKAPLSISIMADDIIEILNYLSIEKAIILGFSDGGNIALEMAIKYSNRLIAIIVISGNVFPNGLIPSFRLITKLYYYFWSTLSLFHIKVNKQRQLSSLIANQPKISYKELQNISIPTLIISGEHDVVKQEHTLAIAKATPNAEVHMIKGANHMALFHDSSEYIKVILAFLNKN